jgi:hypothetical protein
MERHVYDDAAGATLGLRPIDHSKPVLLLDVDGVVNAISTKDTHPWADDEAISPSFKEYLKFDEERADKFLLVEPLSRQGLTPLHVAQMDDWLERFR